MSITRADIPKVTMRSRKLRSNLTDAEQKLWNVIRRRGLNGYRFYRQKPIGNYIADFVCAEKKLVIEIDGGQHSVNQVYDNARTYYMQSCGYKVIRFWNNDVLQNLTGVLEVILGELENLPPPNLPHKVGEAKEGAGI